MIGESSIVRDDILLAETLSDLLSFEPEIELFDQVMRSTTFRFVPLDLHRKQGTESVSAYLDWLNTELSAQLGRRSTLPLCEERIHGSVAIRASVFDTGYSSTGGSGAGDSAAGDSDARVRSIPCLVAQVGRHLDTKLRCQTGFLG